MSEIDYYEFPNCMHALGAALHRENIDPAVVEISLPHDEWWRLWCALDRKFKGRKFKGLMAFDGRSIVPTEFQYLGFKFVVKK